jgi:hypothetical protein
VAYAKEVAPQGYWNSSLFLHINHAISAVWAAAFTASAVIGFSMILQDRCPAELSLPCQPRGNRRCCDFD